LRGANCRITPGSTPSLKAPYVENVRDAGKYDAAILGVPFDGGTTFRPGTRFGSQAIRRISALYTPYNFEIGVDAGGRSTPPLGSLESAPIGHSRVDGETLRNASLVNILDGWPSGLRHRS
jgi:arginase family enzyme